jgi:hypothetical protein
MLSRCIVSFVQNPLSVGHGLAGQAHLVGYPDRFRCRCYRQVQILSDSPGNICQDQNRFDLDNTPLVAGVAAGMTLGALWVS